MLRFDLCQSKQDARHHPADRPTQVDLLGHGHDPDTTLTPVGRQVHAVALAAGFVLKESVRQGRLRPRRDPGKPDDLAA
jgi:hypothetical protein